MSYTFNVSYNGVSKKISGPRSATINDFIVASLDKFKIPTSKTGELTHDGKKLDGLLPVRLTSLVNNAKLVLTVALGSGNVTLKVAAQVENESKTQIILIARSSTLAELIDGFRAKAGVQGDWSDKRVQLHVIHSKKDSTVDSFDAISVGSLVGTATNAQVRLLVENRGLQDARAKLQEEQRVLRQQLEEKKRQERLLQKQEQEQRAETQQPQSNSKDVEMEEAPSSSDASEVNRSPVGSSNHGNSVAEAPVHNLEQTPDSRKAAEPEPQPEFAATPMSGPSHQSFEVPQEKEDTLYVPHSRTTHYENPEEDYNLTVNQAEKYYKMIKSMQTTSRTSKKEVVAPTKYVIRIRFPDRSLLDLPIEDSSIKLGQLLKKIDTYVSDKFINTYKLKNGLPPFKEISMGFAENNTPLKSHPDFQLEKLLLIWEPVLKQSHGPYLKEGITVKDASELPTVLLENHRGDLEAEQDVQSLPRILKKTSDTGDKKLKGIPKWFKRP